MSKNRVHLFQADLKAHKKKVNDFMADLGRYIAKLVRLAYPNADIMNREVIGDQCIPRST